MKEEQWIKDIRQRLHRHERQAPQGLLDDVKAELAKRQTPVARPLAANHGNMRLWSYRLAGVAAALLLGFFLWTDFSQEEKQISRVSHQQRPFPLSETPASAPTRPAIAPENHPGRRMTAYVPAAHASAMPAPNADPNISETALQPGASIAPATQQDATTRETTEQQEDNIATQDAPKARQRPTYPSHTNRHRPKRPSDSPVSIASYYGGSAANSHSSSGMLLATANPIGPYDNELSGRNTSKTPVGEADFEQHTKHRQPVKVGVSVRYRLNQRWAVQSGITYSYLSSETTSGTEHAKQRLDRSLHYVGIPVAATYTLIDSRHFQIYATAGMEAAKLVKGTTTTQTTDAPQATRQETKLKEGRPQFSIAGAIGAEYKISRETGLYIEPGISHHFHNGSVIENIYKDRPTNLQINVGFRIHINP